MNRRYKRKQNSSRIKEVLSSHIEDNLKEYLIVSLIFFIGVIVGVIFINKASETQKAEITEYISSFVTNLKDNNSVDDIALLLESIKKNSILAIFLWFMGSTIIGVSIVYLTVCFRGFCLGYTFSSVILSLRNPERELYF